jgi:hypothetical protein
MCECFFETFFMFACIEYQQELAIPPENKPETLNREVQIAVLELVLRVPKLST